MSGFILRGVLLPLIFLITFQIYAENLVNELFDVFYSDLKSYSKWVGSNQDNTFKDIFINLYNLPSVGKRKYSNNVEIKLLDGLSESKVQNAYSYLEFTNRTSVNFVIWGIKSGSIKINGAEKGDIKVKNDTGFALLKATFEKGVYFISIKIRERFPGVPVIVLSDRKVKTSERGFNREAASIAKIYNIKARYPGVEISALYSGFCFPYGRESSRDVFYSLSLKKDFPEKAGNSLLHKLYSLIVNDKGILELKKTGFRKKQLEWWKKQLFEKEVCAYE